MGGCWAGGRGAGAGDKVGQHLSLHGVDTFYCTRGSMRGRGSGGGGGGGGGGGRDIVMQKNDIGTQLFYFSFIVFQNYFQIVSSSHFQLFSISQ